MSMLNRLKMLPYVTLVTLMLPYARFFHKNFHNNLFSFVAFAPGAEHIHHICQPLVFLIDELLHIYHFIIQIG